MGHQHVIRAETRMDIKQQVETARQKTRYDYHHQREGNLSGDENVTEPAGIRFRSPSAASQDLVEISRRIPEGRNQAKNQCREQRDQGREEQYPRIDPYVLQS